MGIFSSETEVTVAVSNNKLFDSENLPNTIRDAVTTAIFKSQDIPAHLQIAALTNFSANAKKYLSYGRSQYYRGLPVAIGNFYDTDPEGVTAAIESEIGEPVTLIFSDIVQLVTVYEGYEYLQEEYGWTELINEVVFGNTTYEVLTIKYSGKVEQVCTDVDTDTNLQFCTDEIPARFTITYGEVGNISNQRIEYKNNKGGGGVRYNVRYYITSTNNPADVRYWTYKLSKGTYPDLDQSKGQLIDGTFYPVAGIREKFKNVNKDTSSVAYKTTDRLLRKINLNINVLTDAIMENPSKKDIHSAFITLSLNMDTILEEGDEYLAIFFRELFFITPVDKAKFDAARRKDPYWQSSNKLNIVESKYNATIKFDYITLKGSNEDDSLGPVGTVTKSKVEHEGYIPEYDEDSQPIGDPIFRYPSTDYIFQYQTPAGQETLTIKNLTVTSKIGGERITTSKELLIPVKVEILEKFNSFVEERILLDSLYLVAYAYHEEEIAWYQSGFFQFLLTFAVIAISIYFGPVNGGQIGAALAAASAGNYTLIISLLTNFLISFAINYGIIWLAQELGGVLGAIALVVAYYYLPVKYGGAGGQMKGMPFAETLLKATSSYLQIEAQEIQVELTEIQEDSVIFAAEVESRQEELDAAKDLLGSENYAFDPLFILDIGIYFSPEETAAGFYERTLNFDPGSLTLEAVDLYVDSALVLPEAEQTVNSLIGNNAQIENSNSTNWFTI